MHNMKKENKLSAFIKKKKKKKENYLYEMRWLRDVLKLYIIILYM